MSSCPAHPGLREKWSRGPHLAPPARATAWRRVRPLGGTQPSPTPAARTHIVDDYRLVGDVVVGLHGPAEPALPSRRAAGGPASYKERGGLQGAPEDPDGRDSYKGAAPLPQCEPDPVANHSCQLA